MLLKAALRGVGWVSAFSIAKMVANLVLTVVLARLLAPAEVGDFVFALAILSFLQIFAQLGVNMAAVQIEGVAPQFFSVAFTIVLGASVSVTFLTIGLIEISGLIAASAAEALDGLYILAFSLPFFCIADFFQALYNRNLQFRTPAAIDFASYLVGFGVVSLTLASLGFGAYAMITAFIAQHALRSLFFYLSIESRPAISLGANGEVRQILRYGIGFSVAKVGNVVALQIDNLIVANSLGNAALGVYSRAYQITMSPVNLITSIVDRVLFPLMSRRQKDPATLRQAFLMLNTLIFAVFLPLSLLLYEYSYDLIFVLLGSDWSDASVPFGLFGVALSFRAGYRLSDIVARALGYVYKRAIVQWIYAGAVALGAIIGANWGLGGLALGVGIAVAINWALMTSLTMYSLEIGISELLKSLRASVFPIALVYLAAAGLNLALGRSLPLTHSSAYAPAFIIVAILSGAFSASIARKALRDWIELFQRAGRAG